jgi:hypothetical protein
VWLEGLGKLKKKSTSLGLEPGTFWLVAQRFNQLCYRMPHSNDKTDIIGSDGEF